MWPDRLTLLLLAVAGSACAAPTQAERPESPADLAPHSALSLYQAKDQRLQDIGWRLVAGNAAFCENARLSVGLQLLDAAGFGDPEAIQAALGIEGDFVVQTAAAGSPSALAGLITNQPIRNIDGTMPDMWPAQVKHDWERLKRAHDLIDASLDAEGEVEIGLSADEKVRLKGVQVCASRFELETGSKRAVAEGLRVVIGESFAGFVYAEDELAAAIAHELAHNLLAHRAWLEGEGRSQRNIRLTEREADRLMPWLLANAGYGAAAAVRFMEKWGPRHDGGIFRARTHDGWDERAELIAGELPQIAALMAESGSADWQVHFKRETAPVE